MFDIFLLSQVPQITAQDGIAATLREYPTAELWKILGAFFLICLISQAVTSLANYFLQKNLIKFEAEKAFNEVLAKEKLALFKEIYKKIQAVRLLLLTTKSKAACNVSELNQLLSEVECCFTENELEHAREVVDMLLIYSQNKDRYTMQDIVKKLKEFKAAVKNE